VAVKLTQSLKQTQQMIMTPQMQQAIKMLTLTHQEMSTAISDELLENPILEEVNDEINHEDNHNEETQSEEFSAEQSGDENYSKEGSEDRVELETREATAESFTEAPAIGKDEFDWESYLESYNSTTHNSPNMATVDLSEDGPNYENLVTRGQSLQDHLEWQLRMETLTEDEMEFAQNIIHNINDEGYLEVKFEDLLKETKLPKEHAEHLHRLVLRLDPVGCGAENLADCLLAQARILEERSPLLENVIRHHLNDIKNRDYQKIAKLYGAQEAQVRNCEIILQQFHPKPGRLISPGEVQYVIPDIYIVKAGDEYVVQVNDDGIPRLKISKLYQEMLKSSQNDEKAKEYVKEKLNAAKWMMKSVQNRQRTIEKVAKAIVKEQQDFFKKGPKNLRPMILRTIADQVGLHESTISRATTNKFMHTPMGTFELKYFFTTGVGGKDGNAEVSNEVIKLKIKDLIEKENIARPFSDQKISEVLARQNVDVARRTVTKYREEMNIPASSVRKRK
jgi:RNA polymerase sigma-54 factor